MEEAPGARNRAFTRLAGRLPVKPRASLRSALSRVRLYDASRWRANSRLILARPCPGDRDRRIFNARGGRSPSELHLEQVRCYLEFGLIRAIEQRGDELFFEAAHDGTPKRAPLAVS